MGSPSRRIVVLGGGTGIAACLRGLKAHTRDITAIVTVADDGGSSGRLRKDYLMLPPGDARNCLVALACGDPLMSELMNYRFTDSILRGHSFGNLMLTVLTQLGGSFTEALRRCAQLLDCAGEVLPSTEARVVLEALHPDGAKSTGEQAISRCGKPVNSMALRPEPPPISPLLQQRIAEAALIVIGPGSLYTSLAPNLLVPGMVQAIEDSPARCILVSNLMTQPGETDGFDLARHVSQLKRVTGLKRIDRVLCSSTRPEGEVLAHYAAAGAEPVLFPATAERVDGIELIRAPLSTVLPGGMVRHDSERLAALVLAQLDKSHA
jgi:uncharacterized cofD-like protein